LFGINGAVVLTVVGALWFGLFFLSHPLQKRCARSPDSRRPGVTLSEEILSVPTPEGHALTVRLGESYELTYGWWEYLAKGTGASLEHVQCADTRDPDAGRGEPVLQGGRLRPRGHCRRLAEGYV
jgi:hypothetical protein